LWLCCFNMLSVWVNLSLIFFFFKFEWEVIL
jgi:hypothetical protein